MKDEPHGHRPGLMRLVRASARGERGLRLQAFDEDTIRWAIDTGLGPLLVRATADDPDTARSRLWPLLQGANLTARLLSALQMDAMAEIIDACRGEVPPLVLLKGISMCEHDYPEPHLRPMRDLDFLVEEDWTLRVEAILTRLGYVHRSERSDAFYATHHHVAPFFHPDTGIWVDVHRALFGPSSEFGADGVFTVQTLQAELRPSRFRGRVVRRLSDELQLVHVACHWAHGLRVVGGMIAMADISYLLNTPTSIRWGQILRWMDGSAAARHLSLLLTYLDQRGLIDVAPDVIHRLRLQQSALDRVTTALGHALLDRYVVGGHDFGAVMSEMNFQRLWRIAVLRKRPSRTFGLRSAWRLRSRSSPAATVGGPR
jgi:hypothetical protein